MRHHSDDTKQSKAEIVSLGNRVADRIIQLGDLSHPCQGLV